MSVSDSAAPDTVVLIHGFWVTPRSWQDTFVNYDNDQRAPLLFISGTHDHLMPPSVQRSNAKHYTSNTVTEVVEFDGPHLLPSRDSWQEVADYALDWAVKHAVRSPL